MRVFLFNPALTSTNLGDYIIADSVKTHIRDIFPEVRIVEASTHTYLTRHIRKIAGDSQFSFVGGSNLLSPTMLKYRSWKLRLRDVALMRDQILMGPGWGNYSDQTDLLSRFVYRNVLSRHRLHSVRDSYTRAKLVGIGVKNVVNTGCPTLWSLTPEFCRQIPAEKSDTAVVTLTDYHRDLNADRFFLEKMVRLYPEVWFWPQGFYDLDYFHEVCSAELKARIRLVPSTLDAYDEFLANTQCDYVGTRLHGGIRALHHQRRALIISIDNRAREMGRDFRLNVIERSRLSSELESTVNQDMRADVRINQRNIDDFKSQF